MTNDLRKLVEKWRADADEYARMGCSGLASIKQDCADQLQAALDAQAGNPDTAKLDYIERTFSGMTNRERYLPVKMIWGKGCNGRTLREACDKYMGSGFAGPVEGGSETSSGS